MSRQERKMQRIAILGRLAARSNGAFNASLFLERFTNNDIDRKLRFRLFIIMLIQFVADIQDRRQSAFSFIHVWERIREGTKRRERDCVNRQKKDKARDDKERKVYNLFCTQTLVFFYVRHRSRLLFVRFVYVSDLLKKSLLSPVSSFRVGL